LNSHCYPQASPLPYGVVLVINQPLFPFQILPPVFLLLLATRYFCCCLLLLAAAAYTSLHCCRSSPIAPTTRHLHPFALRPIRPPSRYHSSIHTHHQLSFLSSILQKRLLAALFFHCPIRLPSPSTRPPEPNRPTQLSQPYSLVLRPRSAFSPPPPRHAQCSTSHSSTAAASPKLSSLLPSADLKPTLPISFLLNSCQSFPTGIATPLVRSSPTHPSAEHSHFRSPKTVSRKLLQIALTPTTGP